MPLVSLKVFKHVIPPRINRLTPAKLPAGQGRPRGGREQPQRPPGMPPSSPTHRLPIEHDERQPRPPEMITHGKARLTPTDHRDIDMIRHETAHAFVSPDAATEEGRPQQFSIRKPIRLFMRP
jgi:hypothetical protein